MPVNACLGASFCELIVGGKRPLRLRSNQSINRSGNICAHQYDCVYNGTDRNLLNTVYSLHAITMEVKRPTSSMRPGSNLPSGDCNVCLSEF